MRQKAIEELLPAVFRRTLAPREPLAALLQVMEDLHAPSEEALGRLDAYLDPRRAPDAFVPFLARWVDLGRLVEERPGRSEPQALGEAIDLGCLRRLVAAAAELSRWRGTSAGLLRFLELATGVPGFALDEEVPDASGMPRPYHVRVRVPAAASSRLALIRRIVELEKPAYVTFETVVETEAGSEAPKRGRRPGRARADRTPPSEET